MLFFTFFYVNAQVYLDDYFTDPANPTFCEYKEAMDAANQSTEKRLIIRAGTWNVPEPPEITACDGTAISNSANDERRIALVPIDGVTIEFKKGAVLYQATTNKDKIRIIELKNDDVHVEGRGTIRGDLASHHSLTSPKGGENTYLIYVNHGATNWSIKDVTLTESWGDGIAVGGSRHLPGTIILANATEGGLIENITADNNRRNGISVTWSNNLTIKNSRVINTGKLVLENEFDRVRPGAGIDVEPNYWGDVTNLVIEDVLAENNAGNGFTIQAPYTNYELEGYPPTTGNVTLNNVIARGNGALGYTIAVHGLEVKEGGFATVNNIISENNTGDGIRIDGAGGCENDITNYEDPEFHINKCDQCNCDYPVLRKNQGKATITGGLVQNNGKHGLFIDNNENLADGTGNGIYGGDNKIKSLFFKNNGVAQINTYDNIHIQNGLSNLIENCKIVCSNESQVTRHNIYIESNVYIDPSAINPNVTVTNCDFGFSSMNTSCVYPNDINIVDWSTDTNNCSTDNQVPTITSNGAGEGAAINIIENETFVTTVIANNLNGCMNSNMTYEIVYPPNDGVVENFDQEFFEINSSTGELRFINAPDYENPLDSNADQVYIVQVKATNYAGEYDWQRLFVTVLNTGPIITSNGAGQGAAVEILENETFVTTVTANNSNECMSNNMTYEIVYPPNDGVVENFDQEFFEINSSTGELRFINAPDYENPLDSNLDREYIVQVKVTDCEGEYDWQRLFVSVTNDLAGRQSTTNTIFNSKVNTIQLSIFPNPTTQFIVISGATNDYEYKFYNLSGQVVQKGTVSQENNSIDTSNLKTGFYLLSIKNHGTYKIIKK